MTNYRPDAARFRVRFGAYIFNDQKQILLMKNQRNLWAIVGGHMEEGETPDEALKREVMEEASIEIDVICPFMVTTQDDSVIITSVAMYKSGDIKLSEEHSDYKWLDLDELEAFEPSFPELPQRARNACEKI
jgi:8-oxo-dGTP pyrophosphatase MutT (NUDIX family)